MRQGQQNRRGRGRGGRKAPNPLVRNYESSGPDVKIRGTAAQIAEKYSTLARDAMSAGDIVAAESYLQHAEHYNRIIMAAQSQNPSMGQYSNEGYNNGVPANMRQPEEYNGYREQPAYEEEQPLPPPQPRPKPSHSRQQQHLPSPAAPDSPQPVIPAAPAPRETPAPREANEGGRRRRRRHQPNGAEHPLAEASESAGRGANGALRNGGMASSDESAA